jgi:hypothetical protein
MEALKSGEAYEWNPAEMEDFIHDFLPMGYNHIALPDNKHLFTCEQEGCLCIFKTVEQCLTHDHEMHPKPTPPELWPGVPTPQVPDDWHEVAMADWLEKKRMLKEHGLPDNYYELVIAEHLQDRDMEVEEQGIPREQRFAAQSHDAEGPAFKTLQKQHNMAPEARGTRQNRFAPLIAQRQESKKNAIKKKEPKSEEDKHQTSDNSEKSQELEEEHEPENQHFSEVKIFRPSATSMLNAGHQRRLQWNEPIQAPPSPQVSSARKYTFVHYQPPANDNVNNFAPEKDKRT